MLSCLDLRQKLALLQEQALEFHQEFAKLQPLENVKELEQMDVIKKLFRQMTKEIGELKEILSGWKKEIINKEKEVLEKFFGKKIEVPPLPKEITPERLKKWQEKDLELHFLPAENMTQNREIKGWKKPDYRHINASKFPPDATELPGCWVLVDARQKPNWQSGNQMYDNDFLGLVLQELRNKGLIERYKHSQSRFHIPPQNLEKPEVIEAIAKAYGLKPEQLSLQREIEFNVIGNIHHPEWGTTSSSEWFGDRYDSVHGRLRGGSSDYGGLAYVDWYDLDYRRDIIGFRFLVRFPQK